MKKRLLMIAAAMMLAATSLAGCASSVNADETVLKVNDTKLSAGVANFYARYIQAQYETYYAAYLGDNMWNTEADEGKTYEESVKDSVMDTLELMLVLEDHMEDYDVSLTDEEKEAVKKTAKQFDEDNSLENKEKIRSDNDSVERLLTLLAIQQKMTDAIQEDADTKVSDDEAAQKKMDYVLFSYTKEDSSKDESGSDSEKSAEMTGEEKADVKKKAEEFAKSAQEDNLQFAELAKEADAEVQSATFDSESTTPSEDLIAAADKLEKGEVSDVVETDEGCYVARVTSLKDKDATETKKTEIVQQRKTDLFNEVTDEWKDDADIKVYKSVWEKVDFNDVSVTIKQTESEPYTDKIQTDDQAETDEEE